LGLTLEYNPNSGVPVLTPGKSFILGYTNEVYGIFNNLPVILFDDFTTASQFVDFKFKVKSSALKILKPRTNEYDIVFLYALIQLIQFDATDHKRYWISEYQNIEIHIPIEEEQTRIAQILSDMDTEIKKLETKLSKYKMLKTGMMQELLTGKKRLV
jgi:type I restriction enzyme, S subunit